MILQTFFPHAALTSYVVQFIVVQSENEPVPAFNLVPRSFPAFFFMAPEMMIVENVIGNNAYPFEKGNIYFSGFGGEPARMHIRENTRFIVAILSPANTGMCLRENAFCFTNIVQRVTDLNSDLRLLNELLWNEETPIKKQITQIENYLFKLIKKPSGHSSVLRAIDAVKDTQGKIDMKTLAEKSWTCKRNLQRLFNQQVGVSPKQYISMVRFNSFMKEYIASPNTNIITLSEKYHYYDLSHLNKTFIHYMGTSPTFSRVDDQTVNKLIV